MAQVDLPIDAQDAAGSVRVSLTGVDYKLEWAWNVRGEFWSLRLLTSDDAPVATAFLRAGQDAFGGYRRRERLAGAVLTVDLAEEGADPDRDNLGGRLVVCLVDGPDLFEFAA